MLNSVFSAKIEDCDNFTYFKFNLMADRQYLMALVCLPSLLVKLNCFLRNWLLTRVKCILNPIEQNKIKTCHHLKAKKKDSKIIWRNSSGDQLLIPTARDTHFQTVNYCHQIDVKQIESNFLKFKMFASIFLCLIYLSVLIHR